MMGNEFYIRSSRTKDRKSQFESERVRSIAHRLDHRSAGRSRRLRRVSARSSSPDEPQARGYDRTATGNGERIVPTAITELLHGR
jgi:hypothetical protein